MMREHMLTIMAVALVLSLMGNVYLGWKLHHAGGARVNTMLHAHLDSHTAGRDYRVVFIGNSLTLHPLADYWWGEWGMAASDAEHDYVHETVQGLSQDRHVMADAMNFAAWETMGHDRQEVLPLLDQFTAKDVDLYVVQLGENVSKDLATMPDDLERLLKTLHERSPKAHVLVLGGFWPNEKLDAIKQATCTKLGDTYISLSDLQGEVYQSRVGATVKDNNGDEHISNHPGVAKHPGDAGMQAMADKILATVRAAE